MLPFFTCCLLGALAGMVCFGGFVRYAKQRWGGLGNLEPATTPLQRLYRCYTNLLVFPHYNDADARDFGICLGAIAGAAGGALFAWRNPNLAFYLSMVVYVAALAEIVWYDIVPHILPAMASVSELLLKIAPGGVKPFSTGERVEVLSQGIPGRADGWHAAKIASYIGAIDPKSGHPERYAVRFDADTGTAAEAYSPQTIRRPQTLEQPVSEGA